MHDQPGFQLHTTLHACQSIEYGHRGIGRYVHDVVLSLVQRYRPFVGSLYLSPDLPSSPLIKDFAGYGLLKGLKDETTSLRSAVVDNPSGQVDLFHLMSPVDLTMLLQTLIPREFSHGSVPLVATLFDVIPLIYPDIYLADEGVRKSFLTRLRLYEEADHVIAISEASRADGIKFLGLKPEQVSAVYPLVSDHFKPHAESRSAALTELRRRMPDVKGPYLLYVGGIDHRKNMRGAIDAFSRLPSELRRSRQFVIVCQTRDIDRKNLFDYARSRGVADRVLTTGFIDNDLLLNLYQACDLFVFPSLYEGFGLPVVEAMKCGAPVIVGDNSSLKEIVELEAGRFDAGNPDDIARCIETVLSSPSVRQELITYGLERGRTFSEERCTDDLISIYGQVAARNSHFARRRHRSHIAFCTPYPPEESGIAGYSQRVLASLCQQFPVLVDVVVSGPIEHYGPPTPGLSFVSPRQFARLARLGEYDEIVYCMGNSHYHGYIYELLREIPGIVWLHDPRLTGFYGWYWGEKLHQPAYPTPRELLPWAERYGKLADSVLTMDLASLEEGGVFLAGEVVSSAKKVIVNSQFARDVVELESATHVPVLAIPPGEQPLPSSSVTWSDLAAKYGLTESRRPIISMGFVASMKWPRLIASAFAPLHESSPDAVLVFVGDCPNSIQAEIRRDLRGKTALDSVLFTGYVDEEELIAWLKFAACAIEVRYPATGGSSGAVMRCLAAGTPTITGDNGPFRELPDDALYKISTPPNQEEMRQAMASILGDQELVASMRAASLAYAEATSLENVARSLWKVLSS